MTQDKLCPNCQSPKDIQAITLNNTCAVCGRDVGKGKCVTQDKQESWETWEMGFDKFRNFDGCEYGSDFHSRVKAFIRSTLSHQREEITKEIKGMKKNDLMVEAKDNDFHRYQIPYSKTDEWREWLKIPAEDERSWEPPEWAERIDGMPVTNAISYNQALDDVLAKLVVKKDHE